MRKDIITISDNGAVSVPTNVQMKDFEIANLLGVMVPTVKGKIKTLLKSRFAHDCNGGIVVGNSVVPEYFGLEVIIAIAFQVNSYQSYIFRKWVIKRLVNNRLDRSTQIFIQLSNGQIMN